MDHKYPISIFLLTPGSLKRTRLVLESLAHQTFSDFEILVGTDGIKSITEEAIEPYKKELNIKHIYLNDQKDFRFGKIFNKCLAASTGKYCLILAHDLLVPPKGVEILYKKIKIFGNKFYLSPIRKEIDPKKLYKKDIGNNFKNIITQSKTLYHQNKLYYCEPDSGSILARKHLIKIGGQFDLINNISTVGEYKIRLREEAGIKQKTLSNLPIIHIAHKTRLYLGPQHSIQYALRSLAKKKVPRNFIINYLKKHPEVIDQLLEKSGRFKPNHKKYYYNLIEQGSLTGHQIALEYYKRK